MAGSRAGERLVDQSEESSHVFRLFMELHNPYIDIIHMIIYVCIMSHVTETHISYVNMYTVHARTHARTRAPRDLYSSIVQRTPFLTRGSLIAYCAHDVKVALHVSWRRARSHRATRSRSS